jgi:hypothetical protein
VFDGLLGNIVISVGEASAHTGGQTLVWYRALRRENMRTTVAPMTAKRPYVHPDTLIRPLLDDLQ